jgi:hypothetical protein
MAPTLAPVLLLLVLQTVQLVGYLHGVQRAWYCVWVCYLVPSDESYSQKSSLRDTARRWVPLVTAEHHLRPLQDRCSQDATERNVCHSQHANVGIEKPMCTITHSETSNKRSTSHKQF